MKKLIVIVIIFIVITFFIIGNKKEDQKDKDIQVFLNDQEERRAMFISYIELEEYIKDKDNNTSKDNIVKILDNMKNNNFNMAIVHVRPFSDAIYPSKIYPYSRYVSSSEGVNPGYDILEYFIEQAHKRNNAIIRIGIY